MTSLRIELPPKLIPVFTGPADIRGSWGGRGSAKTRSFAKMIAVRGLMFAQADVHGIMVCAREFMNSLAESSMSEVKAAVESEPWLKENYEVGEKYIRTKCGRVSFEFIGLRHNLESVKSKARILIMWVDEAEPVTDYAWNLVEPTIRENGSELWVTWNPDRKNSATEKRFRLNPPPMSKIVELNWRDNPWFPEKLERLRLRYLETMPEQYDWIWEGGYRTIVEGAYYAPMLAEAKQKGRVGRVSPDPLLTVRSYHDIGGAGAKADAYTIWVVQFVNHEIRILDYYESQGQTLSFHVNWMRDRGWEKAQVILPHDGANTNNITGKRYKDHWEDAGFDVRVIVNQGQGAAMQRIEAGRRIFGQCWFNEDTTEAGRDALGWYHEKRDDDRNIGLGPEHDWSSHAADAFGLMAIDYEPPAGGEIMKSLYGKTGRRGSFLNA